MDNQIKEPTVQVPVSDLLHLISKHDEWVGCMHPDEREEYLAEYEYFRKLALRKLRSFNRNTLSN